MLGEGGGRITTRSSTRWKRISSGQTIPRDNPLPSTGRDGKLHSYVLTITPKYLNKNDIVVKVNSV